MKGSPAVDVEGAPCVDNQDKDEDPSEDEELSDVSVANKGRAGVLIYRRIIVYRVVGN